MARCCAFGTGSCLDGGRLLDSSNRNQQKRRSFGSPSEVRGTILTHLLQQGGTVLALPRMQPGTVLALPLMRPGTVLQQRGTVLTHFLNAIFWKYRFGESGSLPACLSTSLNLLYK